MHGQTCQSAFRAGTSTHAVRISPHELVDGGHAESVGMGWARSRSSYSAPCPHALRTSATCRARRTRLVKAALRAAMRAYMSVVGRVGRGRRRAGRARKRPRRWVLRVSPCASTRAVRLVALKDSEDIVQNSHLGQWRLGVSTRRVQSRAHGLHTRTGGVRRAGYRYVGRALFLRCMPRARYRAFSPFVCAPR